MSGLRSSTLTGTETPKPHSSQPFYYLLADDIGIGYSMDHFGSLLIMGLTSCNRTKYLHHSCLGATD